MNILKKISSIFLYINGAIKKYYNRKKIWKLYQEVENYWRDVVANYFEGKLEIYELKPKQQFSSEKIIWQYWGQGIENSALPEVVQMCFSSVDKHKGEYKVIRLSDETISHYIDLPDFVWEKRKNPAFNRTFFSDLLRLALLNTYGGVWLDATILLTDTLPVRFAKLDYFIYQRDDEVLNKAYWESTDVHYWGWHPNYKVRILNSIIFARKDSAVISAMLNLILYYWKTQNRIIDYFFFQILYNLLIQTKFVNEKCPVVSDTIPHLLQAKIKYPDMSSITDEEIVKLGSIHKMAYFRNNRLERLKSFYKKYI